MARSGTAVSTANPLIAVGGTLFHHFPRMQAFGLQHFIHHSTAGASGQVVDLHIPRAGCKRPRIQLDGGHTWRRAEALTGWATVCLRQVPVCSQLGQKNRGCAQPLFHLTLN